MSGMAYVDVIFGSSAGLDRHRQEIIDRVAACRAGLPANVRSRSAPPRPAPVGSFEYALVNPSVSGASGPFGQLQDNLFRPALEAIPGVAEVGVGGRAGSGASRSR